MTVTVNPKVTPTFTQVPPICEGGTFTLLTTSNKGIDGTWSPAINTTTTTYLYILPLLLVSVPTLQRDRDCDPKVTPTSRRWDRYVVALAFTLPTTSNNGIDEPGRLRSITNYDDNLYIHSLLPVSGANTGNDDGDHPCRNTPNMLHKLVRYVAATAILLLPQHI
jgi:hypothetical protein